MPYADKEDPGWIELKRRLQDALTPFAQELGARVCEHGDWAECDEANDGIGCYFADTRPKPDALSMIQDWVLVATVADVNTGLHEIVSIDAPHQRHHTTNGLLFTALHE